MASEESVFLINDAVDTITNTHKGQGILVLKNTSTENVSDIDIDYKAESIENYKTLYKKLGINTSLTMSLPGITPSAEVKFLQESNVNQNDVYLFIKAKKIDHIKRITEPELKQDIDYAEAIKNGDAFVKNYGDACVTEEQHGKSIECLIQFKSHERSEATEIKESIQVILDKVKAVDFKIDQEFQAAKKLLDKHKVVNIVCHVKGIDIQPEFGSDIKGLFTFINKFHSTEHDKFALIGYSTTAYNNIIRTVDAANLADGLNDAKEVLTQIDIRFNKLRFIDNTLDSIRKLHNDHLPKKTNDFNISDLTSGASNAKAGLEDMLSEVRKKLTVWPDGRKAGYLKKIRELDVLIKSLENMAAQLNRLPRLVGSTTSNAKNYSWHVKKASKSFHIETPQLPRLFWEAKSTNPEVDSDKINFKVKIKKAEVDENGTITYGKKYHTLFKDVKGSGHRTDHNHIDPLDKLAIYNVHGAQKAPFTVNVYAEAPEDKNTQKDGNNNNNNASINDNNNDLSTIKKPSGPS